MRFMNEHAGDPARLRNHDDNDEATFDEQAEFFAKELVLDAHDIKKTYIERPESLRAYFNAHAQAEPGVSLIICGLGICALAVVSQLTLLATVPVSALIVIGDFVSGSRKCKQIENTVRQDVEAYRAATTVTAAPAPQPR